MNGLLVKLACLFIPKEQESQKMELKDQLEAHEYLNAQKAGELYESAAFTERFARYKAQYAFPEENENEIRRLDRRIFAFISAAVR